VPKEQPLARILHTREPASAEALRAPGRARDAERVEAAAGNQTILRALGHGRGMPVIDEPSSAEEREAEHATQARGQPPEAPAPLEAGAAPAVDTAPAPLPEADRRHHERQLDTDLSRVRIHADANAQSAAATLGARAFTVGSDIYLGRSAARTSPAGNRALVAHELAHVAQDAHGAPLRIRRQQPPDPTADADTDDKMLRQFLALPGFNVINRAPSVGGLQAWKGRFPRSFDEMWQRAVALYGSAAMNQVWANDATILRLSGKSDELMTKLGKLQSEFAADDDTALAIISDYLGWSEFHWGRGWSSVEGIYEFSYDSIAAKYAKDPGLDLKVYVSLLDHDVDALIADVRRQAREAQDEANAGEAARQEWIATAQAKLGIEVAKREGILLDDKITLEALLDPQEGSENADDMIAVARFSGRMSAVVQVGDRFHAYALSENYSRRQVFLIKDWDQRTEVVRSGPGGGSVVALITSNAYTVTTEGSQSGQRFWGGDQERNPEAYLEADTRLLESGKADALGISAPALFQSMVRNLALANLQQAEKRLDAIVDQMAPDRMLSPQAGASLQQDSARLRELSLAAARLALEMGDRDATDEQLDRRDAVLGEMGAILERDPATGFFVKNSRDPDSKDPVKDEEISDDLKGERSGDAALKAIDEAKRRLANIGVVRRALFDDPSIVLGFEPLHPLVMARFSSTDQLVIKADLIFKQIGAAAATLGLLGADLAFLIAGFATGGATWAGLFIHAGGAALGVYQLNQQMKQADLLTAMSALDVEGGFSLASPEAARSARNWARVGLALNLLGLMGLASSASRLMRAAEQEANLVGRIARGAGVTEETMSLALRRTWSGLPNPDPNALRQIVLAQLPGPLAQRYANLPITILTEEQWLARFGAKSASQAATNFGKTATGELVANGILFRQTGNVMVLQEEALHIAQAADPALAGNIASLERVTGAAWEAMDTATRLRTTRLALQLEMDAQERLLAQAQRAGDTEALEDAFSMMEEYSRRLADVDAALANPAASGYTRWFEAAHPPTLFSSPRLPRSMGSWLGTPGNSVWTSTRPEVLEIVADGRVRFRNGYPDFSPWSRGQVQIGMTGAAEDFAEADRAFAQGVMNRTRPVPDGFSRADFIYNGEPNAAAAARYRQAAGLTWHHHQGGNIMMLVPTKLHANIPHTGGASAARAAL
jgi:hypothetical protein